MAPRYHSLVSSLHRGGLLAFLVAFGFGCGDSTAESSIPPAASTEKPAQAEPKAPKQKQTPSEDLSLSDVSAHGNLDDSPSTEKRLVNTGNVQEIMSEDFADADSRYWGEELISNELIAGPLLALKVHLLGEWSGASSLPDIEEVFYPDAKISAFSPSEFEISEITEGVVRRDWTGATNYLSLPDWLAALAHEHSLAKRVRWATTKPAELHIDGDVVTLTMKYRFNRELKAGGILHDHGYWYSEWTKNEHGEWRCRKMGPKKDCYTVESSAPHFVDVSGEALKGTFFDPRLPKEMKGTNRTLVVTDFDNDGDPDLLTMLPTRLLYNRGDGTFEDRTQDLLPPRFQEDGKGIGSFDAAIAADLDHDGDIDFLCTGKRLRLTCFLQEPDGTFKARALAPLVNNHIPSSLSAHDVDGDGFLEIFIGGYGPFINPGPNDPTNATNGRRNIVVKILGPRMQIEDVTEKWGFLEESTRWAFLGAWGDADQDGDIDLYVANDFGPNVLYRRDNTSEVHFTAELQDAVATDIGFSMSATWGDLDGDLDNDLYVSNMSSTAAKRVVAMGGDPNQSEELGMDLNSIRLRMSKGNTIYMQGEDNMLAEGTSEQGARGASWAWGTALFDYDCDGDIDIHCVNGFWTQGADDGRDL
ncbi:MAG: hypothetical protein ACI8TQ_001853 [Planctomycetota bacterium]|jgi:hypothetical protein